MLKKQPQASALNRNQRKRRNRALKKQVQKLEELGIGGISGNGGYYTDKVLPFMRDLVPAGTFAAGGGKMGGAVGALTGVPGAAQVGGAVGKWIGSNISKLVGFGKYQVESNSILREGNIVPEGTEVPAFGSMNNGTRLQHREYIRDVVVPSSPTVFTNSSTNINPANGTLFPWLATVAAMYQQYQFHGIVFEFKTLSSDITAGGALGSVILATNYDVLDAPFPTKAEMENSQYAVSAKPSCSQVHAVECDPRQQASKLLYIRDSTISSGAVSDARFYDMGNFQIATAGLPASAGTVLGELWVTYDITLYKPQIAQPFSTLVEKATCSTGVSKTAIFGTAPTYAGGSLFTAVTNTITFTNAGQFLVVVYAQGTGLASPANSGTATINQQALAAGTDVTQQPIVYAVKCISPGMTLVCNLSASTTVTSASVYVTPANYNFLIA